MKNKKGKYFITLICVFLIISLGVFLYFVNKNNNRGNALGDIGHKANKILGAYQDAESALLFIDMSAKYSAPGAYFMTAYEGAMPEDSDCGRYYDFAMWDFEDENCMPSGNENLQNSFSSQMNKQLDDYFQLYLDSTIPLDNYEINAFEKDFPVSGQTSGEFSASPQTETKLVISGDTINPLLFEVKDIGNFQEIGVPITLPTRPIGKTDVERIAFIINTYGDTIKKYCEPLGIPEALMVGLIMQESGGDWSQISWTGCAGLNQFCYKTAQGFEVFQKLQKCNCQGKSCTYGIAACNELNDDRFNTDKSINAGCKLLSQDINYFKGKTSKVEFGIASYNGGSGTIEQAIARTGESDPSWELVSSRITSGLVVSLGFPDSKAAEIRGYVPSIEKFQAEAERQLSTPKTGGATT